MAHHESWRSLLARQKKAASRSKAEKICLCTRAGASQRYGRDRGPALRHPGQERAWHLQEGPGLVRTSGRRAGSCASRLPPRQADLGDNPTTPPRATGLPSPGQPFPPETIPQSRSPKELLIFRWYRQHLHLFCCCHLIANCRQPSSAQPPQRRTQTWGHGTTTSVSLGPGDPLWEGITTTH